MIIYLEPNLTKQASVKDTAKPKYDMAKFTVPRNLPPKPSQHKTSAEEFQKKTEDRIKRYVESKKMGSMTRKGVIHKKPVTRLEQEQHKVQKLTQKYDDLMISTQQLYSTFQELNAVEIVEKLDLFEIMHARLMRTNEQLKTAHKASFFFLNFFKDFESQLVNSAEIWNNPKIYDTVNKLSREYNVHSLNLDLEEFEQWVHENNMLLPRLSTDSLNLDETKLKLKQLEAELSNLKQSCLGDVLASPRSKLEYTNIDRR